MVVMVEGKFSYTSYLVQLYYWVWSEQINIKYKLLLVLQENFSFSYCWLVNMVPSLPPMMYMNLGLLQMQFCSEGSSSVIQRGHSSSSIPHYVRLQERKIWVGIPREASKVRVNFWRLSQCKHLKVLNMARCGHSECKAR